jgi:drug/metabolite transporter (DMT)-like permease
VFFYFPLETNTELLFQPIVLFNLLFLGVLASLICFLLWTIVLKRIGAVRVTNYVYLNPLITLVASTFLLGEKITPITLGGTALLLTGVILVERWKR